MSEQLKNSVHTFDTNSPANKYIPAEIFCKTQNYLLNLRESHTTLTVEMIRQLELSIESDPFSVLTADRHHCHNCLQQILINLDEIEKTLDKYSNTDVLLEEGDIQ